MGNYVAFLSALTTLFLSIPFGQSHQREGVVCSLETVLFLPSSSLQKSRRQSQKRSKSRMFPFCQGLNAPEGARRVVTVQRLQNADEAARSFAKPFSTPLKSKINSHLLISVLLINQFKKRQPVVGISQRLVCSLGPMHRINVFIYFKINFISCIYTFEFFPLPQECDCDYLLSGRA